MPASPTEEQEEVATGDLEQRTRVRKRGARKKQPGTTAGNEDGLQVTQAGPQVMRMGDLFSRYGQRRHLLETADEEHEPPSAASASTSALPEAPIEEERKRNRTRSKRGKGTAQQAASAGSLLDQPQAGSLLEDALEEADQNAHGGVGNGGTAQVLDDGYVTKMRLSYRFFVADAEGGVSEDENKAGELKGTTLQQQYGDDLDLIKVELPKVDRQELVTILSRPLRTPAGMYRLDRIRQGSAGVAMGIAADQAHRIPQMPAPELAEYARQGLLTQPITGAVISARVRLASVGAEFPLPEGQPLEVNDGFGFIRESIAQAMGIGASGVDPARAGKIPSTKQGLREPARPNTQMLQWMREDNGVVVELVEHAIKNLKAQLDESPSRDSNKQIYRSVTTGNFPVMYGTAVPVPGQNIVLSVELGDGQPRAMLHRSPADKPNWATADVEPSDSTLSRSLQRLTAIQYRMQQQAESGQPLMMLKGLLGVIRDDEWPAKFAADGIVACVTDAKVDSRWRSERDVKSAKADTGARVLDFTGTFAVTSVLEPGSLVGVPGPLMQQLSGDYDGDAVHVLLESECPLLFAALDTVETWNNPKIDKAYSFPAQGGPRAPQAATASGSGLAERLADVNAADAITGVWSTAADLLKTMDPDLLPSWLPTIRTIVNHSLATQQVGGAVTLRDPQALWSLVGLGIKVGTDLAKTNLNKVIFEGITLTAEQWSTTGANLNRDLRQQLGLSNPHARGPKESGERKNETKIVNDVRAGGPIASIEAALPAHYGMPGRILRAVNEHLAIEREEAESGDSGAESTALRATLEPSAEQMERALSAVTAAAADSVGPDTLIAAVHQLIGDLAAVLQGEQRTKVGNRDADRWMIRALRKVNQEDLPAKIAAWPARAAEREQGANAIFQLAVRQLSRQFEQFAGAKLNE